MIKFSSDEEGKRRRKLAMVMLLLCVPYPMWAGWAAVAHRLPSPQVIPVIFVLNFAVIFGIFKLYRRHLYKGREKD